MFVYYLNSRNIKILTINLKQTKITITEYRTENDLDFVIKKSFNLSRQRLASLASSTCYNCSKENLNTVGSFGFDDFFFKWSVVN